MFARNKKPPKKRQSAHRGLDHRGVGLRKIVRRKVFSGFSLAELLVSMAILSLLMVATTNILVQVMRVKGTAEARADIVDGLEHSVGIIKDHLTESSAGEIDCGETAEAVCDLQGSCPEGSQCDSADLYFHVDGDSRLVMIRNKDEEDEALTYLTSSDVKVTGLRFNQVNDYVFILIKAVDADEEFISEDEAVIIQDSAIVRN